MAKIEKRITQLEKETAKPDFWQNQKKAQQMSEELAHLKDETGLWQDLEKEVTELNELAKLSEEDKKLEKEIEKRFREVKKRFEQEEFKTILSGKYDRNNALLSVYAGAGGTDAQDWAEMLLRMYLRWAERKNLQAKVLDISAGSEAGIKSVTLEVKGPYAYGFLKAEAGVHRLVRLSPFSADNLRHTSFALIEVLPEIPEVAEVEIDPKDLRIDTFRASGPGGQYVNKTSSAVRITHLPTKIVASCQSERSQAQNKEKAMELLRLKLYRQKQAKKEEKKAEIRGEVLPAEWGSQIRSYVLHPYKLVKDHRTKLETSKVEEVLDGDLDQFIQAYLKK